MARYAEGRLHDFSTQAVSNMLWGCATLNFYDADLYTAAAANIQRAHSRSVPLRAPLLPCTILSASALHRECVVGAIGWHTPFGAGCAMVQHADAPSEATLLCAPTCCRADRQLQRPGDLQHAALLREDGARGLAAHAGHFRPRCCRSCYAFL